MPLEALRPFRGGESHYTTAIPDPALLSLRQLERPEGDERMVASAGCKGAVAAAACAAVIGACSGGGSFSGPPSGTPAPLGLVVLHTNDNWGETKPCG